MDYSELITAVKNEDEATTSKLCRQAGSILHRYLTFKLGASSQDAGDAIQMMFEHLIRKIKNGDEFRNPTGLLSYMLVTSKNNYLNRLRKIESEQTVGMVTEPLVDRDPMDGLIESELQVALKGCIQHLQNDHQEFIQFYFENPDVETEAIAERFGISEMNVWTRKHRILKKIQECIEKKL